MREFMHEKKTFSVCQQCKENDFHVIPRCENSFQEILIGFYKRVYAMKMRFSNLQFCAK